MGTGARAAAGLALIPLLLGGCALVQYPSQARPICSWASTPPRGAGALCTTTFRTLKTLASSEARGDNASIRRLVADSKVARRIIAYGATARGERAYNLHIVPSLTLDTSLPGLVGAAFDLAAQGRLGQIHVSETVYLRIRRGTAVVVHDQPGEEW